VKELEDAVIELVGLSELSVQFSSAVQVFTNRYQPGEEVLDTFCLVPLIISMCMLLLIIWNLTILFLFQLQFTNFSTLFEDELSEFKAKQSSDLPKHRLIRQFKEAVWVCCFVLPCG